MKKGVESFEDLEVYRLAEQLADKIWNMASKWNGFAKNTIGYQLVSVHPKMVDFGSGQGRSVFATAGVVRLR